MTDDRSAFTEARAVGKARSQEQRLTADPLKALAYLLAQYDLVVNVHAQVVMDTPEDRELHDRAVATFRAAAEPIRKALAQEWSANTWRSIASGIAREVASQPPQASSTGPTAPTGHSDLPPTPAAGRDPHGVVDLVGKLREAVDAARKRRLADLPEGRDR